MNTRISQRLGKACCFCLEWPLASYNEIMHNLRLQPPYCDVKADNCGSLIIPYVYCIFFFIFSSFVLLNLLIAIVIEAFTTITELDNASVRPIHLANFKAVWAKYDPDGDSMVPTKNLLDLLSEVEYPLGLLNTPDQPPMTDALLKSASSDFFSRRNPMDPLYFQFCITSFWEANFHEFLSA